MYKNDFSWMGLLWHFVGGALVQLTSLINLGVAVILYLVGSGLALGWLGFIGLCGGLRGLRGVVKRIFPC